MTQEHTPGPWRQEPTSTGRHGDYKIMSQAGIICRVYVDEANARLIAAAPTMAAMLIKHADLGDDEALEILQAAGIR